MATHISKNAKESPEPTKGDVKGTFILTSSLIAVLHIASSYYLAISVWYFRKCPQVVARNSSAERTWPVFCGGYELQPLVRWHGHHAQLHLQGWLVSSCQDVPFLLNVKVNTLFISLPGDVIHRSRFLHSDTYQSNMAANRIVVSEMGTMAYPDPSKNLIVK